MEKLKPSLDGPTHISNIVLASETRWQVAKLKFLTPWYFRYQKVKRIYTKNHGWSNFNVTNILITLQYPTYAVCRADCTMEHYSCTEVLDLADGDRGIGCCNCFPASAKISLENGKSITMSDLQIGDAVKSGELTFILKYY